MDQIPGQQLPPLPTSTSSGFNPRIISIIASVIIFILIIAISLYWFLVIRPQVDSQTNTTPASQDDTTTVTPSDQSDNTSNWFLYVNTTGKYRLKYPPNFKKTSIKKEDLDPYTRQHQFESPKYEAAIIGSGFSSEGEGSVFFADTCDEESCEDSITKLNSKLLTGKIKDEKDIKIDGINAKRFVYIGASGEQSVNIEFSKDEIIYSIKLDHGKHELDSEHLDLFNKMLDTFEFIN